MANLYQIAHQLENFDFEVDEETGEFINAVQWDDLNMQYAEKVENIACYIKNLNSDVASIKAEEDALKKRRRSKEKKVEWLKRLLADNMCGEKFESSKCAVSFRKSVALDVLDETMIPAEYMVETVSIKPDANAIKKLLKDGIAVSGCQLKENINTQIC